MTSPGGAALSRPDVRAMFGAVPPGLSIAADPSQGIVTCRVPAVPASGGARGVEPLIMKFPAVPAMAPAVEREARLLVELRRRRLGEVESTIPRHVGMRDLDGLPVALSSTVPGRPMSLAERHWLHAVRPWGVRRDFQYAGDWLARLQEASASGRSPITWPAEVTRSLRDRWAGHPLLEPGLERLGTAAAQLDGCVVDLTVVHGDFWHAHVLVDAERAVVTGVLDWTRAELEGCPLRDLARFALRYSRASLWGSGWYPRIVQAYLRAGLLRLGVPPDRWSDVAVVGTAEIASQDVDERSASDHLALLARVPARGRVPAQRR